MLDQGIHRLRIPVTGRSIGAIGSTEPTNEDNSPVCVFCGKRFTASRMIVEGDARSCRRCATRYDFPRRYPTTVPNVVIVELVGGSFQFYFYIDWGDDGVFWLRRYTSDVNDWNRREVSEVYRDHPGVWIAHVSNEFGHLPKWWRNAAMIL